MEAGKAYLNISYCQIRKNYFFECVYFTGLFLETFRQSSGVRRCKIGAHLGNGSTVLPKEGPKDGLPTAGTKCLAAVGEKSAMDSRRLNLQGKARKLKGECQPPVSSERALKY